MAPVSAEIKAILYFGDGASEDMSTFNPQDPTHFRVSVQLLIGVSGSEPADSFDLVVCSPSRFAEDAGGDGRALGATVVGMPLSTTVGTGIWFMPTWEQRAFESAVNVLCQACGPGPDWGSVASRISRYAPWEYDYRYDAHMDEHPGEQFPPSR